MLLRGFHGLKAASLSSRNTAKRCLVAFVLVVFASVGLNGADRDDVDGTTVNMRERYGSAASEAVILRTALKAVRTKGEAVNEDSVRAVRERLASLAAPSKENLEERRRRSRIWKLMADTTHAVEGFSERLIEELESAAELDPDDEEVKAELEFQKRRLELLELREETVRNLRGEGEGAEKSDRPNATISNR